MLVSEPNYQAAKHFLEKLLAMEMSKTNGQAGLSGSIDSRHEQDIMYNYWYAYVKPKYIEKAKLC